MDPATMALLAQSGANLLGGLLGSKEQDKALGKAMQAAEFKPWGMSSFFGSSSFDPKTNQINLGLSDPMQGVVGLLMGNVLSSLNSDPSEVYNKMSALSQADENRAVLGLENRLFSQGRLGSTGGALEMGAMANSLANNRMNRELAALNYQNTLFNQALQGISGLGQIHSTLMNQAGLGSNIGLGNAQIGASMADAIMGVGRNKSDAISGLFGGISKAIGGLF